MISHGSNFTSDTCRALDALFDKYEHKRLPEDPVPTGSRKRITAPKLTGNPSSTYVDTTHAPAQFQWIQEKVARYFELPEHVLVCHSYIGRGEQEKRAHKVFIYLLYRVTGWDQEYIARLVSRTRRSVLDAHKHVIHTRKRDSGLDKAVRTIENKLLE